MPESTLVDSLGRPYPASPPTRRTADVTTTGIREQAYSSVSRGLTPGRLATILDSANEGDITDFLTLAEDMEERDLHYFSLLGTRKLSIVGAPQSIQPYDDSPRAIEIALAAEQHVMKKPNFSGLQFDMLDSLSKGFAVVQPVWDTTKRPWTYKEFYYTDPRWFTVDRNDLSKFLLRSDAHPDGGPIPPGRFVFHFPKIRSGLPIKGGLARIAAINFMLKTYTLKDWVAFMEVFGMPTRIGRYDRLTTTDQEKDTLLAALRGIGHDAAAMIPDGMNIELLDAKRPSGGDSLFGGLAGYLDKQVSKAVLGQTMTSDDGASLAQAKVHQMVRQDILDADAWQLTATINAQIIAPWVRYNYGENAPMPEFKIQTQPPEDLKAFTDGLLPWVKQGLEIPQAWLSEKFGVPEIDGDEDTLGGETEAEDPVIDPLDPTGDPAAGPGDLAEVATNAELPPNLDETEEQAEELATQWEQTLGPHRDVLNEIAKESTSYEDFLKRLDKAKNRFPSDQFVRRLAVEMAKARGLASA